MITSSSFTVGVPQADGRVWITETHVDSVAGEMLFSYLAADDSGAQAVMTARAAQIADDLADAEFEAIINGA